MKKILLFMSIITCLSGFHVTFGQQEVIATSAQNGDSKNNAPQSSPEVITGRLIRVSPKLSDMKPVLLDPGLKPFGEEEQDLRQRVNKNARIFDGDPNAIIIDGSVQKSTKSPSLNSPNPLNAVIQSFNGNGQAENTSRGFGLLVPPDPVVTVGPNHVVQMINLVHRVYNKSGTALTLPLKFSEIAGTATNAGDPITLYDQMADRWVLMQFSNILTNGQESLIFCISQTNDPTGAYYIYEFKTVGFLPDYPHMGIWSNSYSLTTHNFNTSGSGYQSQGYWAFDRKKMLNGDPTATAVLFREPGAYGYLPVSIEGLKVPDPTALLTFVNYDLTNQLKVRTLSPNFSNVGASVLSAATILPVATFNPTVSTIPQNSPGFNLDALGGRMMSRIIYRKFDNYESMVLNHTVDSDPTATFQAAPRWYELTRPNAASPWVVNQQSTYAPSGVHRWMACAGIDQRGNIALGYSRSSATNNADLYWAERKKTDALSTLGTEQIFHAAGGVQQSNTGRWGDYSAMVIDPTDEETMWYTGEYYAATSDRGFSTRIGSFKINDPITSPTVHFATGGIIARQIESVTPAVGLPNFPFKDYPITILIDNAPSQDANITLTKTGTATEGIDYNILNASPLVLNGTTLSQSFTVRVYDDGLYDEPNEFIDFAYTLNANGGDAIVGSYNQQHRVTIIGKSFCPAPSVNYTCLGNIATLTAICGKGTPTWYDATGTNVEFTGSPFTTPTLAGATTYQIKCVGNDCGLFPYRVTVFPTRIYVKSDAKGSNTGADWENAYTELSSALNLACNSGLTEVWVAKGTYRPTSCTTCDLTDAAKNISFNIPSGKKVYGGFAGNEVNLLDRNLALIHTTNLTTLSGDLKEDDGANFTNADDNSKTIIKFIGSNVNTLLEGFMVKGGNGVAEGGGINIASGSSPQITNCIITENNTLGFTLDQQSTSFGTSGNGITTATYGGQTFTPAVSGTLTKADINLFCSGCTGTTPNLTLSVRATSAGLPTGADLTSATINGFNSGSAVYYTANFATPATLTAGTQYALIIRPTANPSAGTYAIIRSGTSTAGSDVYAGGTRVTGTTSGTVWSIPLTGGVSTDAAFHTFMVSSSANGGGIQNNGTLTVTNSVLSKNASVLSGGAIYNTGTLTVINSTINANTAPAGGAIFSSGALGVSTLTNDISFGNTNSFGNAGGGTASASYSLFDNMSNVTNVSNNLITVASPFVSASDLHLACASPAINVGTTTNAPLKDFEGKARPFVGEVSLVDMGAYEFQGDVTFMASSNSPVCLGTTLNLNTAGGTSYAWAGPNSFTSTLQNPPINTVTSAAAGTYTVTITYGSSCTATATTSVIVNDLPTASGSSNSPICVGATLELSGVGEERAYSWAGPGGYTSNLQDPTIPNVSIAAAGVYTLMVTSISGCIGSTTISVIINSSPTATASSNAPICVGATLNLIGGASGNTYAWAGPDSFTSTAQSPIISSIAFAGGGIYTLTVTNANSCAAIATTNVTVDDLPILPAVSSNSPICTGETIFVSAGEYSNSYNYSWTGPNTFTSTTIEFNIPNATTSATGTYILTGTFNACSATSTLAITVNALPTATISSNSPICAGSTLNLIGGGVGNYLWTGPGGYTSSAQNPSISNAIVGNSGTYTITVTNANSCTSSATVAVTVNSNPSATASSNSPICAGNTLNLIGGGVGSSYAWTSSNGFTSTAQSPTINNATILASGTYMITVTNISGCTSTASVVVIVNSAPTATASSNSPVCVGNTISLTSGGVGNYLWTGPSGYTSTAQNPSISNAIVGNSGTYTITVTNANSCTSTATVAVTVNSNPSATASSSTPVICAGNSISLTGGGVGTYLWTGPNGFTSTAQSPTIAGATVLATGTYTITVTNASSCTSTATTSVTVNATPMATASGNSPVCVGNTISLTGGGVGNYLWTGPGGYTLSAQSPSITNAIVGNSGTYTITVTNANSCTSSATVAVTVNSNPSATASSNSPICAGNTLNLIGGGVGSSYAWISSNGFTSTAQSPTISNATVSATGTYTITVTNVNGCTSSATTSVTVIFVSPPTPITSTITLCGGSSITLTATGCSGINDVLKWYRSYDDVFVSMPFIPTYPLYYAKCERTINGITCTSNKSSEVNVIITNPETPFVVGTTICKGESVSILTANCTDAGKIRRWYRSSDDIEVTMPVSPTITTNYYARCEQTVNGITCLSPKSPSTATITVLDPPTPVAQGATICTGASITLSATLCTNANQYLKWYKQADNTLVTMPVSPSVTTQYYAKCQENSTESSWICFSPASNNVSVIVLNPLIPTQQANTQIIFGASITLTATGCSGVNDVLKWYKSSDNFLVVMPVSPTVTTNYYAKCETTLNGITCISGNSSNVTVTVLQPNPPVATGATNCLGTPTTLTTTGCSGSVGTFVLKWYQNADDALVTMPVSPSTTTDYYAKCEQTFNAVTAISAKSNVVTLTILNPPTPVSTGGTIYNGQSISLTATGCTGTLGTFTLKWYQTSDNVLVTMPVSPTVTTQYYAKCEQTANSVTCLSAKSNDVTVTVVNRIFVDITKIAAPIQNGNSWATAYGNLQTGLAAATAGVEVWVAKGTYKPTNTIDRNITFIIPNNVKVYGGFFNTEDLLSERNFRTNISILNGEIGDLGSTLDNTRHVVTFNGSSASTVFDGFTITGGNANFDPKNTVSYPVAPITVLLSRGGGITVENAGNPVITNCIFMSNSAITGGGLFAGDNSKPTIKTCKFIGNLASFGAGMYFQDGSHAKIDNTLISGNRSIGAIYNNFSNPVITNCTFGGNGGYNGGIFNSNSNPVMNNSIVWGNSSPFNDTQTIITYSTIQGGYTGVGNLSIDPNYINQTPEGLSPSITGDYHLQVSSLAIDRGNNGSIALTDKDLDGNLRRFAGGRVDMGAYEFIGIATTTLVISVVTGPWEANSTWDIGRVPQLGDYVIIDSNHIVTLNGTGVAKSLEYRGTGKLKFNTNTSKIEIGF